MTEASSIATASARFPWNKGKIIGAKPPLRPKHLWSIRTKLQVENRIRHLALFNLAIDSKLRGCDVVALKVDDVAPAVTRLNVPRCGRRRLVARLGSNSPRRQAIEDYVKAADKKLGQYLFTGGSNRSLTTRQYSRLVREWIASIGLDPRLFGTHSLRRTKATLIYRRTGNLRAVQLLLGSH